MVDCERIDMAKVAETLEYLDQENDLPMQRAELRKRFKELFCSDCPV